MTGRKQGWVITIAVMAIFAGGSASVASDFGNRRFRIHDVPNNTSRSGCVKSWDDASRQIASPMDASKAVKTRVKYSQDLMPEDEWRDGKGTWDKGQGDCEDFACAVKDLCAENGFKAEIYVLESKTARAAHAVTIGEMNGVLWMSSNGSYEEVQSLDDAREKLSRDLGWWAPEVDVSKVGNTSVNNDRRYVRSAALDARSYRE